MKMILALVFLQFIGVCHTAPARFINYDAAEWLQYFGYLNGEIGPLELERYQDALEKMQKNYQIPATRDIDVLTEMEMLFPRCGVPDRVPEGDRDENNMQTNKRFVTVDTKWNKDTISYRLSLPSSDLPVITQRAIVQQAFRVWSEVIPLTFYETNGPEVDIDIGFYYGQHGDNYPFRGDVLGHAFYPPGSSSVVDTISGDVHINDAHRYVEDPGTDGYYLLAVLIHEIGHTLGLDHSTQKGTVMHTSYGTSTELTYDDIAGIQSIYGVYPEDSVQKVTSYDAIYYKDYALHLVKGDKLFVQYPSGGSSNEYLLRSAIPGNIDRLDSATVIDGYIVYIKDNLMWMYDDTAQVSVGYPRQLETIGVPGDTDLVFWVPSENALYFFHGDNYYKFEIGQTVALSQPISSKFDSAVAEADAAFAYNDEIIFVRRTFCYSYDLNSGILKGPHDFSQDMDFTKCGTVRLLISLPLLVMVALLSRFIFV